MDMPAQRLSRRLQQALLAFFLLATLLLVAVYIAAPSLYKDTLSLIPFPTGRSPAAAILLLAGVGVFTALLMIGVLRRWRWVFWLVLVAFGAMILDVPATILQLTGVLPVLFPLWYSLCRMGISLIAVGIGVWMLHLYRHHGVWALGRNARSHTPASDAASPRRKGASERIAGGSDHLFLQEIGGHSTKGEPGVLRNQVHCSVVRKGGKAHERAGAAARRRYGSLTGHAGYAADG